MLIIVTIINSVRADRNGEPLLVTDQELERAFRFGLSAAGKTNEDFALNVSRHGYTLHFKSSLNTESPRRIAELVCLLCTKEEALSQARELGALTRCRTDGILPARITVKGNRAGTRITVDSVPLVPHQIGHSLIQGEHTISVEREGTEISKEISVDEGTKIKLDLSSSLFTPRNKLRPALVWGGIGLSTAAIGTMFLLLDGQCATTEVIGGECRYNHELRVAGWSTIGAGVAIELSLIIWLIVANGDRELVFKEY